VPTPIERGDDRGLGDLREGEITLGLDRAIENIPALALRGLREPRPGPGILIAGDGQASVPAAARGAR
jgi:hypothetical protein